MMRITKFQATDVHGHLPINIEFFDELTFLTGLNGSGKTTALRLLMALLTPNFDELGVISFSRAAVTIQDSGEEVVISAIRSSDGVFVEVSDVAEALAISATDLEILLEMRRRWEERPGTSADEARSPIREKIFNTQVSERIREISTPMFLGLDRKFFGIPNIQEDPSDARRRDFVLRRYFPEEGGKTTAIAGLADINYLVSQRSQEIRASQAKLDEDLRRKFFTKAFEYKPGDFFRGGAKNPSRAELETYRVHLDTIEQAAEVLRLPLPDLQLALSGFLEKMSAVVDSLERGAKAVQKSEKGKKTTSRIRETSFTPPVDLLEWMVNKPQADRILEHLKLLKSYVSSRDALFEPLDRFVALVNDFFIQTNKKIQIKTSGELTVHLGPDARRSIGALSSGERQLLIMLGHLSLNPSLIGSGVFIVDEPELSLHIDWQERFVEAVRAANSGVQLIFATHSPAIILDREDLCVSLS